MPQFIRAAGYKIYFWSNESGEPIHFHATKGDPDKNDTKKQPYRNHLNYFIVLVEFADGANFRMDVILAITTDSSSINNEIELIFLPIPFR